MFQKKVLECFINFSPVEIKNTQKTYKFNLEGSFLGFLEFSKIAFLVCKSVFIVEGRGVVSKPRVSVSDFARVGVLLTEMTRFATMVKVTVMDNALTTMADELEGVELTVEEVTIVRETLGAIRHEMDVMKMRPYVTGQSMEDDRRKVAALKQQKTILRLGVEVKDMMCSILTFVVSVIIIVCIYIFVYYMCM